MKMTTGIIIGVIVLLTLAGVYTLMKKHKSVENEAKNENVSKTEAQDNHYAGLRTQAINVTTEQLEIIIDDDKAVYGIVMDWNMGDVIVTVVSFKTGDASIYLSTGQVFIGGIAHETVINASKNFVEVAVKHFEKAAKTDKIEPTNEAKVDFYFLTKSGKYYVDDFVSQIENGKSELSELFTAGNGVITEYRLVTEEE